MAQQLDLAGRFDHPQGLEDITGVGQVESGQFSRQCLMGAPGQDVRADDANLAFGHAPGLKLSHQRFYHVGGDNDVVDRHMRVALDRHVGDQRFRAVHRQQNEGVGPHRPVGRAVGDVGKGRVEVCQVHDIAVAVG